ncbi:MAG: LPP20 family lipoprotein [Deltaproteobacteria bacterium]|nr:LPP20 family lipoprotein [Deltaproteobacteria bacterium]
MNWSIWFALGCLSAIVNAVERPIWVNGDTSAKYNPLRYITAVGSGNTREDAIADSKKALAETFIAEVKSVTTSVAQSSLKSSTTAKVEGEDTQDVRKDVQISTNIKLRGMEIKETFYDPQAKTHYALAVLDKMQAKSSYLMELNKRKSRVTSLYEQFSRSASLALVKQLEQRLDEFDSMNNEFAVVNGGMGMQRPLSPEQLEKMRARALELSSKNLVLVKFTEGDSSFHDLVMDCLADSHVHTVSSVEENTKPAYAVSYFLKEELDDAFHVDGWVRYRYTAAGEIKKGATTVGKPNIVKAENGRGKSQCWDKTKDSLSKEMCEKIIDIVTR